MARFSARVGVGGGIIKHKMCVLIFSTTFVWNISHSRMNSVKYHQCMPVFMDKSCYCHVLRKLEFSQQIFEKFSNIKFHENPSIRIWVPRGRTYFTYIHTHSYIHKHIIHTYTHTYTHTYIYTNIHPYKHTYIHTYTHIHTHTHTHTHTLESLNPIARFQTKPNVWLQAWLQLILK